MGLSPDKRPSGHVPHTHMSPLIQRKSHLAVLRWDFGRVRRMTRVMEAVRHAQFGFHTDLR